MSDEIKELEEDLKFYKNITPQAKAYNLAKAAQAHIKYLKHTKPLIDELLEYRKKATKGVWVEGSSKYHEHLVEWNDYTLAYINGSSEHGKPNMKFITKAANIAQKLIDGGG